MEIKKRSRKELDAYLDGYNAAYHDFIKCIDKSVIKMRENRDFLFDTFGRTTKESEEKNNDISGTIK